MASSSKPMEGRKPNRLINEKSPYLLQHAYNPVDWYPWGEEAFKKAVTEDKPIFLSVGYAVCHWCGVMERESFESQQVARLLNSHFVPIKVDREERPDVDAVYMQFLQALTGGGGWPMTVFLTPNLRPFTGGTYFPEPRFIDILNRITDAWKDSRTEVLGQSDRIVKVMKEQVAGVAVIETEVESTISRLAQGAIEEGVKYLENTYDSQYGGFGSGMKFPRPSTLGLLLRAKGVDRDGRTLPMVTATLDGIAQGGIRDHVGGGFHRYSTDRIWFLPHFEKMLYDQAQLLSSYVDTYLVTGKSSYAEVAHETARYVLEGMTDPNIGGFYSAEDADSLVAEGGEKKEGAYYVWTKQEILDALGPEDHEAFCKLFGVKEGGNVDKDPHNEFTGGKNVLMLTKRVDDLTTEEKQLLGRARVKLAAVRERRPKPHRDEKVLVSWNGLMIGALARASMSLPPVSQPDTSDQTGTDKYLEAAIGAARFIKDHMWDQDKGELSRCYFRSAVSPVPALADDYAFLIKGLLDLYEATFEAHYLRWAKQLQSTMDRLFACRPEEGEGEGYLSTLRDDPTIVYPVRSAYDGAEPSATSVACSNLLKLGAYLDDQSLTDRAGHTPVASPQLLASVILYGPSIRQVIIAGKRGAQDTQALVDAVRSLFIPNTIVVFREVKDQGEEVDPDLSLFPEIVRKSGMKDGRATAYTCQNRVCSLPMTDPQALIERLKQQR